LADQHWCFVELHVQVLQYLGYDYHIDSYPAANYQEENYSAEDYQDAHEEDQGQGQHWNEETEMYLDPLANQSTSTYEEHLPDRAAHYNQPSTSRDYYEPPREESYEDIVSIYCPRNLLLGCFMLITFTAINFD